MTLDIVHIEWLDSQCCNEWTLFGEVETELKNTHTVGILVKESERFIVVTHSCDPQTESCNGKITIPKSAIQSRTTLCRVKA